MNTADLRVLYISERAGFAGGIERFIFQTASLLRADGISVCGCFERPDRDHDRFIRNFDRIFTPDHLPDADLAVIHKITDPELLKELIDRWGNRLALYVHDHDYYCPRTYRYIPLGRRDCRRPYSMLRCGVCAMATSPKHWRNGFFPTLAARTTACRKRLELLRQIPRVGVPSNFMRNNLIDNGFAPEAVTVILPPVNIPENLPEREETDPPRMLFTGQLIRGKGVDQLLRALPLLRCKYHLTIAGDGNQRPELERLAEQLGVSSQVDFTGWVSDPERLFSASDIAVMPFFWQEPFGLVGTEAAACGLPIVAFQIGGIDEWLHDGKNGFAVPPRNIPEFAAAIDRLLASSELRKQFGSWGRKLMQERFSSREFVRRFRQWAQKGTL